VWFHRFSDRPAPLARQSQKSPLSLVDVLLSPATRFECLCPFSLVISAIAVSSAL
jgi:hypothetical protein